MVVEHDTRASAVLHSLAPAPVRGIQIRQVLMGKLVMLPRGIPQPPLEKQAKQATEQAAKQQVEQQVEQSVEQPSEQPAIVYRKRPTDETATVAPKRSKSSESLTSSTTFSVVELSPSVRSRSPSASSSAPSTQVSSQGGQPGRLSGGGKPPAFSISPALKPRSDYCSM